MIRLSGRMRPQTPSATAAAEPIPVSGRVRINTDTIAHHLGSPGDLIVREFTSGTDEHPLALVFIDGMVNERAVAALIRSLRLKYRSVSLADFDAPTADIRLEALSAHDINETATIEEAMLAVLAGDAALFVEGASAALIISSKGFEKRSIEEPLTEAIIRGPREGFTEDLRVNSALIRRRIIDPSLRFRSYTLGWRSRRRALVAYMEGIAHPALLQEVERRMATIDIDDIQGSGMVEQWIGDSFLSPFPLVMNTERPDKVSGSLLQGRVAVLVDGDPFVLVLPITFNSALQSPEDYYQSWLISSLTRVLRLLAAFLATFLPALYIALLEFHHGMIPTKLAFSIAGAREGVPFPAVVEAFAMEATLELLREAGLRLPKPIGQTIGIVGGLVIGEAAVSAGIVSPIMVIVVAITAISSFALPAYSFAISLRMLRFGVMLAAALMGLYGIIMAYIMINVHFVNLKSFGIPYSTPFAPTFFADWKDSILRAPIHFLKERPKLMQPADKRRIR